MKIFNGHLLAASLLLAGCQQEGWQHPLDAWQPQSPVDIEDIRLLGTSIGTDSGTDIDVGGATAMMVVASESQGLLLLDGNGNVLATLPGSFERLDVRQDKDSLVVATVDRDRQQVMITAAENGQWQESRWLPSPGFGIEGVCLQHEGPLLLANVLGEDGQGGQFLIADADAWLEVAALVRRLPLPPGAEQCQVDEGTQQLLVLEPGVGVWAYPAGTEAEYQRQGAALIAPMGVVKSGVDSMVLAANGLWLLDGKANALHQLQFGQGHWQATGHWTLPSRPWTEQLSVRASEQGTVVMLSSDEGLWLGQVDSRPGGVTAAAALAVVLPVVETRPVQKRGDAADDPAIWVNRDKPAASRILGTDKQNGLDVYALDGALLQRLAVGRLNNVDLRYGTDFDIAVASNRDHDSLSVFRIHHGSGQLDLIGEAETSLQDIYGLCMYQPAPDQFQVLANSKDGRYQQYDLTVARSSVQAKLVREFALASQPEGCVADDLNHRLFVGEESRGVWVLDARADQPAALSQVISVGEALHADVEGLGLYAGKDGSVSLVVSSQGNDSYVLLDARPPYALKSVFRIGLNAPAGIDGASETDGLDVTSANLGGVFSDGLLVVQDGRNRMPEAPQNFKLVPWSAVLP